MTFTPPPSIGQFTFPGYGTQGIRLTDASSAPQGCHPRVYPYWSIVNNHRGQSYLYVIVGRVALKPRLVTVSKSSHDVTAERDLPMDGTAEGWYFSDTLTTSFYFLEGASLRRHDVFDGRTSTVFTLDPKHGHHLWQAHSSADDQTHSATVKDVNNKNIGCVVYRNGQQVFIPAHEILDECQIDKSGRWLVIQLLDNIVVDLETNQSHVIRHADGALGHLDVGDCYMIGEDDSGSHWMMTHWNLHDMTKRVLVAGEGAWGSGMGHVAARGRMFLLSSNETGELVRGSLDYDGLVKIAPGMIDGHDYDHQLRACLDPCGEYAAWIAFVGGRFDAFLVRLHDAPPPSIVPLPPPIVTPKPPTGGPVPGYPGDTFFVNEIGKAIAADYAEANQQLNDGSAVWFGRTIWDVVAGDASGRKLSPAESVRKHRKEWRDALHLPPLTGGALPNP